MIKEEEDREMELDTEDKGENGANEEEVLDGFECMSDVEMGRSGL